MNEKLISNLLAQVEQDFGVILQVIVQEPYLCVFINRSPDSQLDYSALTQKIYCALPQEQMPTLVGILFYSRVMGTVTSDWETYVELPSTQEISYPPSSEETQHPSVDQETNEAQLNETSECLVEFDEDLVVEEESLVEHQQENSQTELINSSSTGEITSPLESEESQKNYSFDLSQYCFIRNKGLLNAKILPPSTSIATIIQNLHQVSDTEKQQFLSALKQWIENSQLSLEGFSQEIKKALETITQFDSETQRKALMWLSRYCFNPEETLSQVNAILLAKSTKATPENESSSQETTSENTSQTSPSTKGSQKLKTHKPSLDKKAINIPKKTPKSPSKTKIPLSWIVVWTAFVLMAIGTTFHSNRAASICSSSTSNYCQLVVEIVSGSILKTAAKNAIAVTPQLEVEFQETCSSMGNLQAGIDLKTVMEKDIPPQSIKGEEVLPGIYVADITQANYTTGSSSVRTACVITARSFGQQMDKTNMDVLAVEVIPNDWPKEPYKREVTSIADLQDSLGIFGTLMMLGTGTLFTAIGIILAAISNFGIEIDTVETTFKTAFFFGLVESLFISFWHILITWPPSFFTLLALDSLVLLITSAVVKEFKMQWNLGFRVIAASTAIIIGTRALLNLLLISLISAII